MNAPQYSKYVAGINEVMTEIVCSDGIKRMVRTEQYADGYHAFLTKEDGTYTNHKGYATVRKAINAASKF